MEGHHTVVHLASNPDIAKAATQPSIDFDEGTLLTHNVLEAMRLSGASCILYASGSGVYGDLGELEIDEDHGPLAPISTYGASKLAGESLISAYCHMFGLRARLFRFANVVGARQTHGVGHDFIRALRGDGSHLTILGDGSQSKSYIHIDDVVSAVLLAERRAKENYAVFNVATDDFITVREIAELAVETVGLAADTVRLSFGQGPRGWRGDVPVVRLNTARIKSLGWVCANSSRQAMGRSMTALLEDIRAGKI
jgi:UDP-glucose 4-epimerase